MRSSADIGVFLDWQRHSKTAEAGKDQRYDSNSPGNHGEGEGFKFGFHGEHVFANHDCDKSVECAIATGLPNDKLRSGNELRLKNTCLTIDSQRGIDKAINPSSTALALDQREIKRRAQSREANLARNLPPE